MEEQQKSRLGPTLNNEKIEELFRQLDSNKDGRVDVKELTEGLGKLGVPTIPGQAQVRKLFATPEWYKSQLNLMNLCIILLSYSKPLTFTIE